MEKILVGPSDFFDRGVNSHRIGRGVYVVGNQKIEKNKIYLIKSNNNGILYKVKIIDVWELTRDDKIFYKEKFKNKVGVNGTDWL